MPKKPPSLTAIQKRQLAVLEPALRAAVYSENYELAKKLTTEIQLLLRETGHETRLMQSKVWLFEAALNAGELLTAEAGLIGVCNKTADSTRVHLEAKALLVVCLLRQGRVKDAECHIERVLEGKAIREQGKRRRFIESVTARFQMEGYISAARGVQYGHLNADEIDAAAIEAVKTKSEDELYVEIAAALPRSLIDAVFKIDQASRLRLSMTEVLYLPPPPQEQKSIDRGKTFFSSLKLVLWKSFCDQNSEIYKAWYTNGMSHVLSKKYYAVAVASVLMDVGFAVKAVAIPVTALLMKFGIEIYCDRYKPAEILDDRAKAK